MRRQHIREGLTVLLPLVSAACLGVTDLADDVTVSVSDPLIELIGDRVAMSANITITNSTDGPVAYDQCDAGFQQLTDEGWRFVARNVCNGSRPLWVNPGSQVESWRSNQGFGVQKDPPFEGEYRFAALMTDTDFELHTIASETFYVEPVTR